MIVQINNTNTKAVVSGHVFKYDCPDRVDYGVNNGSNAGKFDAVIKSGHRGKDTDKQDDNSLSGHVSGHRCPDNNGDIDERMNDYIIEFQYITTNESDNRNESGHLSGHECPDKSQNNGINGQSGQNVVGESDGVR